MTLQEQLAEALAVLLKTPEGNSSSMSQEEFTPLRISTEDKLASITLKLIRVKDGYTSLSTTDAKVQLAEMEAMEKVMKPLLSLANEQTVAPDNLTSDNMKVALFQIVQKVVDILRREIQEHQKLLLRQISALEAIEERMEKDEANDTEQDNFDDEDSVYTQFVNILQNTDEESDPRAKSGNALSEILKK